MVFLSSTELFLEEMFFFFFLNPLSETNGLCKNEDVSP